MPTQNHSLCVAAAELAVVPWCIGDSSTVPLCLSPFLSFAVYAVIMMVESGQMWYSPGMHPRRLVFFNLTAEPQIQMYGHGIVTLADVRLFVEIPHRAPLHRS